MTKSLLLTAVLLAATPLCFPADPPSPDAGRKEEQTACIACHSLRLIHSQRLSSAAWAKEVDKMINWGASVQEKQSLIDYLAAQYGDNKPVPAPPLSASEGNKSSPYR